MIFLRQIKTMCRRLSRRLSHGASMEKAQEPLTTTHRKKLRDTAYLDGLKASAAFMVYIHHMTMRYYPMLGDWYGRDPTKYQLIRLPFLRNLFVSGQSMVGVFFVVSGFILTTKPLQLTRKQDHAGLYKTIASCIFRRWFRLWLPAFFSTFIAVIAIYNGLDLDSPDGPLQHPRLPTFYLQVTDWFWEMLRFTSPFNYADHHLQLRMKYDWVTWTLPLEYWAGMSIWVVCMAVCQFPKYTTRLVLLLLGSWYSLYHGAWHFFCFLAGMIIADFQIESKTFECSGRIFAVFTHERRQNLYWMIFIFGLYIAGAPGVELGELHFLTLRPPGYAWLYSLIPNWFREPHRFYVAWTGISLVFATNRLRPLQRVFESRVAQGFARCSFPFFLLHQVLHDIMVRNWLGAVITRTLRLNMQTSFGFNTWYIIMLLVSTPVIYGCSRIFQTYIDDYCTKYVKKLEEYLRSSGTADTPRAPKLCLPVDTVTLDERHWLEERDLEKLEQLQDYRIESRQDYMPHG